MKTSKFTEEQIVKILEEGQAGEQTVEELCRKHGIHKQTYYGWRKKYGGLSTSDLQRMKQLEQENSRLKRAVADLTLDNQVLKEMQAKNGRARSIKRSGMLDADGSPGAQPTPRCEPADDSAIDASLPAANQ